MIKPIMSAMIAASALSMAAATPALAQEGARAPGAEQAMPQVEVSESQLELFAKVSDKLGQVRQEYQAKMAAAESTEDAQKLQEDASNAMVAAVESLGMSVDEYNQIAYAIQADPELRSRLEAMATQ